MNWNKTYLVLLIISALYTYRANLLFSQGNIQEESQVEKEILVQLNNSTDINLLKKFLIKEPSVDYQNQLTRDGLIHSIIVAFAQERSRIMNLLELESYIKYVETNVRVESRSLVPNDEFYFDQYSLNNMKMPRLWADGVNGVTSQGDTIVVAVVELRRTALFHGELNENLWVNYGEIPNDGIDNDQNGYIDDYYGYNGILDHGTNMDLGTEIHGLSVNGVIGGVGNNDFGIAGMTWNVKILNVTAGGSSKTVMKAYDYIYQLRKLYNETGGAKGAYVVVSNSSFGAKDAFARERPIWCEQYNKLFSVGILNVVATKNRDENIDVTGDVPSLCQSESIITVSNINQYDNVHPSGYSFQNVDLSAYGADVLVLSEQNSYANDSGTSFSAPVVTGLVALLYGQACDKFINISKNQPREVVDLMKGFILDKTIPISSQLGRSVTEGKLNPKGTQELLSFYCDNPVSELSIDYIYYNGSGDLIVDFSIPNSGEVEFVIYNTLGQELLRHDDSFGIVDLWVTTIELPQAPTGIYYLVLRKENETRSKAFMVFRN